MKAIEIDKPKDNLEEYLVEAAGYHRSGETEYIESQYIAELNQDQVSFLKKVGSELYEMCLEAVDFVIKNERFEEFGIGPLQAERIKKSWHCETSPLHTEHRDPDIYSRFDLYWDGKDTVKFYEINADSASTTYECSAIQWLVLEDLIKRGQVEAGASQFNHLEDSILKRLKEIKSLLKYDHGNLMHFEASLDSVDGLTTSLYLQELARQAGWNVEFTDTAQIGANEDKTSPHYGFLYDINDQQIKTLHKMMPWEHIYESAYKEYFDNDKLFVIEPHWKAILSNKMISVILWEIFPDHKYLLPSYKTKEPFGETYVEKPIFGRISAGVKIFHKGKVMSRKYAVAHESSEIYDKYPKIYQKVCTTPDLEGMDEWGYVTGLWVMGSGETVGVDFRIDFAYVTGGDTIKFLPHYVKSS